MSGVEAAPRKAFYRRPAVIAAALILPIALVGPSVMMMPRKTAEAALETLMRDPMAFFESRSPGKRASGVLAQTKPRYVVASGGRERPVAGPTERVLSNVRTRPTPLLDGGAPLPVGPDLAAVPLGVPDTFAVGSPAVGGTPSAGGGVPGNFFQPAAPGFGTPGSTPDAPNLPTPPPGALEPAPVTVVPEPSTWLMLIVGFLGVGMAMRRRKGQSTHQYRLENRRIDSTRPQG